MDTVETQIEPTNLEKAQKQVTADLEKYIKDHTSKTQKEAKLYRGQELDQSELDEELTYSFFNNFWLRLPAVKSEDLSKSYFEETSEQIKTLDTPHREFLKASQPKDIELHSPRYLDNTDEDFIRDMNLAFESAIKDGEVSRERLMVFGEKKDGKALDLYSIPVYVRLVALGYNHLDLTE